MTQSIPSTNRPSHGKLSGLTESLRLTIELTRFEMIVNLTKSRFGWSWWFLDPLVMVGVIGVFKGIVMGRDSYQPYFLFLGCSLLCWKFFSTSLVRSSMLLRSREPLIKSFPFPTWVLPFSLVLEQFIFFTTGMLTMTAIAFAIGQPLGFEVIQLVPLMGLCSILTLGLVLVCSTAGVFASDLSQYMNHFMRIGWLLSPGMYGTDLVVKRFGEGSWPHLIFQLNPMALLFEGFRKILYSPQWIPLLDWLKLGCFSGFLFFLGVGVYRHYNRRLVKHF